MTPSAILAEALTGQVLVIDDDDTSLRLMGEMLRVGGFERVILLPDSRQVAEVCTAGAVDLVVLDLSMPHVDGLETMQQIQDALGDQAPPVLIVSGDTRQSMRVLALHAGASDYLNKPVSAPELVARAYRHSMAHQGRKLLHGQKRALESLVQERTTELRASRLQIAQLLGRAAEYRDNETGAHILRMSHASALLAGRLGWSSQDCELMLNASPLHDIGKIAIPDAVLLKQGPLDPAEWEVMKTHTVKGAKILAATDNDALRLAAEIALCHHEKWDGTGYPLGLRREQIPEAARIVAVTDVFDALRSHRPYKQPWSLDRSVEHIRANAGAHFDPDVVRAFDLAADALDGIWHQYADTPSTGA